MPCLSSLFCFEVLESLPTNLLHPVIVLWDTSVGDMGLLCDFMYHGQVNVQQERLPRYVRYMAVIASFVYET